MVENGVLVMCVELTCIATCSHRKWQKSSSLISFFVCSDCAEKIYLHLIENIYSYAIIENKLMTYERSKDIEILLMPKNIIKLLRSWIKIIHPNTIEEWNGIKT